MRRWWQESPVTRKSTKETVTPSRRESRICPVDLWFLTPVLSSLHRRPRVQSAPGFPCALTSQEGERRAKLGHFMPRECGLTSSQFFDSRIRKASASSLRGAIATKQSMPPLAERWIASLTLAMTRTSREWAVALTAARVASLSPRDQIAPATGSRPQTGRHGRSGLAGQG